jgi:hypothetical protein
MVVAMEEAVVTVVVVPLMCAWEMTLLDALWLLQVVAVRIILVVLLGMVMTALEVMPEDSKEVMPT